MKLVWKQWKKKTSRGNIPDLPNIFRAQEERLRRQQKDEADKKAEAEKKRIEEEKRKADEEKRKAEEEKRKASSIFLLS